MSKISDIPKAPFRSYRQQQSDVKRQRHAQSANHGCHNDCAKLLEKSDGAEEEGAGGGDGGKCGGGYGVGHAGKGFFRALDSGMDASCGGSTICMSHMDDKIDR